VLAIANRIRPDAGAAVPFMDKYIPIDPEAQWKQIWDGVLMLFLLYTTFSVPYMLAFVQDRDPQESWTAFQVYDVGLDTLFCSDIILSFVTGYTHLGVYERRLGRIAINYMRTWFFLDFFGSVPFDKITSAVLEGGAEDYEDCAYPQNDPCSSISQQAQTARTKGGPLSQCCSV
jgi:hypothetical protein